MDRPRRAAARRPLIAGVLVAVVAGIVIAGAVGGGGSGGSTAADSGRAAPQLPREVLNPPAVTLASLRGKPSVVNFWASWCEPCIKEAPELERFARSLHGRARLVGVDWGDNADKARAFVARHGWTFPVLRDGSNAVGNRFGIAGLPTTYVLDSNARIVAKLQGPQTAATLDAALRQAS